MMEMHESCLPCTLAAVEKMVRSAQCKTCVEVHGDLVTHAAICVSYGLLTRVAVAKSTLKKPMKITPDQETRHNSSRSMSRRSPASRDYGTPGVLQKNKAPYFSLFNECLNSSGDLFHAGVTYVLSPLCDGRCRNGGESFAACANALFRCCPQSVGDLWITFSLKAEPVRMIFSPVSAWQRLVEETRARSPGRTFDQWFSQVQFESFTDGVLALRAENDFVRQFVSDHYLPEMCARLAGQTGLSVQTAWTLGGVFDAPVVEPEPASEPQPSAAYVLRAVPAKLPPGLSKPVAALPFKEALPFPLDIDPSHTFETFVLGPTNQLAHAASVAASGGVGPRYNPLFLCGPTGVGKTHLLHAIANHVHRMRPDASIVYISAEQFMNEFVDAIKNKRMDEFRAKFREHCDLLLVDDVQSLAGKTQTQEEFFHAFNSLRQAGKTVVLTSDKYPQNLDRMEERLVTRFSAGLVADIQWPELETRIAILRKKAEIDKLFVPDEVVIFLAQSVRRSVRELEGALIRLSAKSGLLGIPLDVNFARQELAMSGQLRTQETSIEDIQRAACHHFALRSTDLVSKDRHKSVAFARHVAMYICKQRLRSSLPEIGRAFGGRDHTTVLSAVRKVENLIESDPHVRAHVEAVTRKISGEME